MTYVFPAHILNPLSVTADVMQRTVSGGESLSGDEDLIATDGGGRWAIEFSEIDLDSPELLRLWTAWSSHLAGGAQQVLVPVLALETAPRPIAGGHHATPSDIDTDDDMFPTNVRFASPYIVAEVGADAALRATTLIINVSLGARIQGGEKFSVGDRSYVIERVISLSGQTATVKISPPLRVAVDSGDEVNFDWPVVLCRAASGQDLRPQVSLGAFATVSIAFVEDFSDVD